MGILDSIGLGSVAKVLDVGGIVKNVVDGVLPHNLASVGDLAGAVVDFKTGNIGAALQHAMETVRDLPQVARGAQSGAGNSAANLNRMSPQFEPSPPPLASRQGKAFDWNDLLAAIKALTAALNKPGTPATPAAPTPASGTATPASATTASSPAPAAPASQPATAPAASTTPAAGSSASAPAAGSSPRPLSPLESTRGWIHSMGAGTWRSGPPPTNWRGLPPPSAPAHSPRTPAPSTQTAPAATSTALKDVAAAVNAAAAAVKSAATAPAANTSAPATTATSAPKPEAPASAGIATTPSAPSAAESNKDKKGAAQPSTGQTISSLAQLNGMSDAAIRDAVINGRISPDILKDQGAMMVLQQRMNAIAEMNSLMTSMMRALHDMQMAVIQNIRI